MKQLNVILQHHNYCTIYDEIMVCDEIIYPGGDTSYWSIIKFDEENKYKFLQRHEYNDGLEFFDYFDLDFNFRKIIIGNQYVYDYREEDTPRWIGNIDHDLENREIIKKIQTNVNLFLFENFENEFEGMKITKYSIN